jgi:hypothetical protein
MCGNNINKQNYKVVGFVGEFVDYANCINCNIELRNDQGFKLSDGNFVCKDTHRCSLRISRNKIEEEKQAGIWNPRWRRIAV